MLKFMQAGFGELIGGKDLTTMVEASVRGVRQATPATQDELNGLQAELDEAGLDVVWVVDREDKIDWLRDESKAEFGNEPDLEHKDISLYLSQYNAAVHRADERIDLSPGAISNLIPRGFDYLLAMIHAVPTFAPIAIHRYPDWPGFDYVHPPARSRDEEVQIVDSITKGRRLWVTEFGYHTADQRRGFFGLGPKRRWSDTQQRDNVAREWEFWARHGAEIAVLYQWRNGPTNANTPLDQYGARGRAVMESFR